MTAAETCQPWDWRDWPLWGPLAAGIRQYPQHSERAPANAPCPLTGLDPGDLSPEQCPSDNDQQHGVRSISTRFYFLSFISTSPDDLEPVSLCGPVLLPTDPEIG